MGFFFRLFNQNIPNENFFPNFEGNFSTGRALANPPTWMHDELNITGLIEAAVAGEPLAIQLVRQAGHGGPAAGSGEREAVEDAGPEAQDAVSLIRSPPACGGGVRSMAAGGGVDGKCGL